MWSSGLARVSRGGAPSACAGDAPHSLLFYIRSRARERLLELRAYACGASVALALSAAAVIRAFRLLTVQLSLNANKAATLAVSAALFGDVSLLRSDCAALVACFAAATGLALAPEPGDSFLDPAFFRAARKCVRPARCQTF